MVRIGQPRANKTCTTSTYIYPSPTYPHANNIPPLYQSTTTTTEHAPSSVTSNRQRKYTINSTKGHGVTDPARTNLDTFLNRLDLRRLSQVYEGSR